MKKCGKYIGLLLLGILGGCDQDDVPNTTTPSVVVNAFQQEFPKAKDISWKSEESQVYEVDFELGKVDHSIRYDGKATILQRKHEIPLRELPAEVLTTIAKKFKGKDLDDAEIVDFDGLIYYQVEINRLLKDRKVVINKRGGINKKIPVWE